MSQFYCKVFIITAIVCSFYSSSVGDFGVVLSSGRCLRPDGSRGICKNLRECEPLFNLLVKGNSRPQLWVTDLLKRSHCGFEGRDPVVCCPVAVREKVNRKILNLTINNPIYEKFLNKSCGSVPVVDKVFGGSETSVHEFPWMTRIGYDTTSGLQFLCGGTLISHRYILTAAHCLIGLKNMTPVLVRLGDHDLENWEKCRDCDECTSPIQDIDIEEIIPHSGFHRSHHQNDIALIRLAKHVEFQNDIRPICLPINREIKDLSNKRGVVTGWGATESAPNSPVLKRATLPIVPLNECSKVYRKEKAYPITESQICAGGQPDQDSCIGDSGGPLQVLEVNPSGGFFWIQYGIVSFGPKLCGKKGMPGVYTKVTHYIKWISENVKE